MDNNDFETRLKRLEEMVDGQFIIMKFLVQLHNMDKEVLLTSLIAIRDGIASASIAAGGEANGKLLAFNKMINEIRDSLP